MRASRVHEGARRVPRRLLHTDDRPTERMLHPRGASFHATPNVSSGASETAPTTTQSWWSAVAVLCLGWALCFSVLTSCERRLTSLPR